jgi:hypothetical protein
MVEIMSLHSIYIIKGTLIEVIGNVELISAKKPLRDPL